MRCGLGGVWVVVGRLWLNFLFSLRNYFFFRNGTEKPIADVCLAKRHANFFHLSKSQLKKVFACEIAITNYYDISNYYDVDIKQPKEEEEKKKSQRDGPTRRRRYVKET